MRRGDTCSPPKPRRWPGPLQSDDSADHRDEDEEHEVECDEGGDAGLEEREKKKDKILTEDKWAAEASNLNDGVVMKIKVFSNDYETIW